MSVLIVGAGPTGLTLACELLRRGIPVRLIDSREKRGSFSKALGIQARTLEHFAQMGIVDEFLKRGLKGKGVAVHWGNKELHFDLDPLETRFPFLLVLPQMDTEEILLTHFEKMGGRIEWKSTLVDLLEKEGKREAHIQLPTGERVVDHSSWIVGCDGAHSSIRHLLNLSFSGYPFPELFLLADIEGDIASSLKTYAHFFLSRKGFCAAIPLPQFQQYRLILPDVPKEEQNLLKVLEERECSDKMQIRTIHWLSSFQIQRRMTKTLRVGNVFLAGDAAHIHSPAGGQGMNTGIQDAFNLAWKLAWVIRGKAFTSLLDTYEKERIPIAKAVLRGTSRATSLITFSQKWSPLLLFSFFKLMLLSKTVRGKVSNQLSQLAIHYKKSRRAPDAPLENGKRVHDYLTDGKYLLLLFTENTPFLTKMRKRYGDILEIVLTHDPEARKIYKAEVYELVCIRPDGYIGYQASKGALLGCEQYLKSIFKT